MLDTVLAYVRRVLSGEVEGDKALGRYLMDTLGVSAIGEKGGEDKAFNASLQVTYIFTFTSQPKLTAGRIGYADDLVPREPRAVTGRGVLQTGSCHFIVVSGGADDL